MNSKTYKTGSAPLNVEAKSVFMAGLKDGRGDFFFRRIIY